MTTITVKLDSMETIRLLKGYREELTSRVLSRALNRTLGVMRTEGSRILSNNTGMRVRDARARLIIRRSTEKTLQGSLIAGGSERIPLTYFGAKQRGKLRAIAKGKRRRRSAIGGGVSVNVGGKAVFIPHAFIASIRGGRPAVLIRAPDYKAQMYDKVRPRHNRLTRSGSDLPIAEIFAPGLPAVFVDRAIVESIERVARVRFPISLAQEVRFMRTRQSKKVT